MASPAQAVLPEPDDGRSLTSSGGALDRMAHQAPAQAGPSDAGAVSDYLQRKFAYSGPNGWLQSRSATARSPAISGGLRKEAPSLQLR